MKLTATVITSHSASEFTDGRARVTVKVAEADNMDNKLKLRNADGLALDDELVVLVLTKEQAADVFAFADKYDSAAATLLADQLRPDPLPPWEQTTVTYDKQQFPDEATTQEFAREVQQ